MSDKLVINKHKPRFVHLSLEDDPKWKTKCGAWTFYGNFYNPVVKIVDMKDVGKFHLCRKCFR